MKSYFKFNRKDCENSGIRAFGKCSKLAYLYKKHNRFFKVNQMQQPFPKKVIFFCLDTGITILYQGVPQKEEQDACKTALANRSDMSIPTKDVLKMMDLIMESTFFKPKEQLLVPIYAWIMPVFTSDNRKKNLFQNVNFQRYLYLKYVD